MSSLKQITVKIDPFTLAGLEAIVSREPYYSRNGIINALLSQLFALSDADLLHVLLSNYYIKESHATRRLCLTDDAASRNPFDGLGILRREILATALAEYTRTNDLPTPRVSIIHGLLEQL